MIWGIHFIGHLRYCTDTDTSRRYMLSTVNSNDHMGIVNTFIIKDTIMILKLKEKLGHKTLDQMSES